MKYKAEKIDVLEDDAWDAEEWCYVVKDGDDYVCICSTQEEVDRICKLLNSEGT